MTFALTKTPPARGRAGFQCVLPIVLGERIPIQLCAVSSECGCGPKRSPGDSLVLRWRFRNCIEVETGTPVRRLSSSSSTRTASCARTTSRQGDGTRRPFSLDAHQPVGRQRTKHPPKHVHKEKTPPKRGRGQVRIRAQLGPTSRRKPSRRQSQKIGRPATSQQPVLTRLLHGTRHTA